MKRNCCRGQSILEYALLLGAVIAVLVVVLLGGGTAGGAGGIKGRIESTYNSVGTALEKTTTDLNKGIFQP